MSDYTDISRPYDALMSRGTDAPEGGGTVGQQGTGTAESGGSVETQPVKDGGSVGDLWITTFIRSKDWKPQKQGFNIEGQTGYAEFSNVYISGAITAVLGTIGGFTIGSDYIRDAANTFGLSSTVSGSDDIRFWAGAEFASRATAPFRVYESGSVVSIVQPIQTYAPANGGTATLDLSQGNDHRVTLTTTGGANPDATLAISNATVGQRFLVSITQSSGGSGTVAWFSTIRWADGTAPSLSDTGNKRDTFGFICTGTNTYDGFIVGLFI